MKAIALLALLLAACSGVTVDGGGTAPADITAAGPGDDPSSGALQIAQWHERADRALEHMLLRFWSASDGTLRGASTSNERAGYWIFAQAFDAVIDGAARTGGARFAGAIETLFEAQNAQGWKRDFFDDENWMTLALLRAHALTHDARYLARAEKLYQDIMTAWDESCCGADRGGLWWNRQHTQKATASNLGPVIAGLWLAEVTGAASYAAFAKKAYHHWSAAMVDDHSHQVADHIDPNGKINWARWSYNEGLMVGASLAMAKATGDSAYLDAAKETAAFMLAHETRPGATGKVLFDGDDAHCHGDSAQFKGIAFRYLAELVRADPAETEVRALLQASAESIWQRDKNGAGLFAADWLGPAEDEVTLGADDSAVMALGQYAALAGPYPVGPEPGVVEAEDAVLHHLGLEAAHHGFSGWGYVAGWDHDGEWLDFHVRAKKPGKHTLSFRYAAGAGNARRLLYVNGKNAVSALSFPRTKSWDGYRTVSAEVELPAGASTISLIYDGALGSKGWLNLDRLAIDP